MARRRGFPRVTPLPGPGAESRSASVAWAVALVGSGGDASAEEHAREVAGLAAATAVRLRAPSTVVERCSLVGLVHDIGKVAIPDTILNKTGTLTASEATLLRTHPDLGADLVARVPELAAAEAGVRHHHERIDGVGYPHGLAGDAIPFEARVVAAVDAYSAMTADRPYRRARSRDDAIVELRVSAGTQLDVGVVEALVAVLMASGVVSCAAAAAVT